MATVPFYGKDSVLAAYDARGIATWGIFEKKELMQVGSDRQELDSFLTMLSKDGSAGTYILRVYRLEDPDDITNRTEANGGFNFKLSERGAMGSTSRGNTLGDIIGQEFQNELESDIREMVRERISGGGSKKGNYLEQLISGFVEEPDKLVNLIGMVKEKFFGGSPVVPMPAPLAAVGNVQAQRQPSQEETLNRVAAALDRWEKVDPQYLDRLEKLVELAVNKPFMYKAACAELDKL